MPMYCLYHILIYLRFQTHAQAKAAIDNVHDSVSSNIGTFTENFLPNKKDDSEIWKNVIDGLVMGFSIGASIIFNKGRFPYHSTALGG